MRTVLYTLIASALVAALVPATALAHGHHGRRHHHSRFHHRIHHKQFGHASAPTTTAMSDNAGTVASFDGTKLSITLADGSSVSGTVNNDTEIECDAADTSSQTSFHRNDQGGDNSGPGDQGDDNNQGDEDGDQTGSCDSSALTPGTIVHEAELKLSGAGAVWDKVELLTSSSSSSSSSDDD